MPGWGSVSLGRVRLTLVHSGAGKLTDLTISHVAEGGWAESEAHPGAFSRLCTNL